MTTFPANVTVTGTETDGNLVITVTQTASVPVPPPNDWMPPSYLRTDKRVETTPNASRPGYLEDFLDPIFMTTITRITGDPGTAITNISGAKWGDVCRHHYSSDQAWNCDQSMIYLDTNTGGTPLFLDGENYTPLFAAKTMPSNADVRWHNTDPAVLNFIDGSNRLGTWNPKTGAQTVLKTFGSEYSGMKFGPWEGSFTADGNFVVISSTKNNQATAFAYDVRSGTKYPDIAATSLADTALGNVRISSKANYIVWGFEPDMVIVTDLEGTKIHTIPSNYVSHFDVITDGSGDECLVGRVNSGSVGQGASGRIAKYRLRDGQRTALSEGGWSYHTSARSMARWSVSGAGNENGNYPPYDGEIIMCALDGSTVYRLGHSHVPHIVDYKAETQASHSPDGGRVIFASPWGAGGNPPRPVGCYVIDFRK